MQGLLMVMSEPPAALEEEFNAWYDLEHIPERAAIEGFQLSRRWIATDPTAAPGRYLATYELASREVLDSPAYLAHAYENMSVWGKRIAARLALVRRWMARETGRAHAGMRAPDPAQVGALFVSIGDIAHGHEAEFNRWYDTEHVPLIERIPGVLRARRWFDANGQPRYVALYELAGPEVREHPGWKEAAGTAWTAKIRAMQGAGERIVRTYVRLPPVKGP